MKKIIALMLAMAMMIGLVACGNSNEKSPETTNPQASEEATNPSESEITETTEPVEDEEVEPSVPEEDVNTPSDEDSDTDAENEANTEDEDAESEKKSKENLKDAAEETKDKIKDNVDKGDGAKNVVKIENTATPDMVFAQALEVFYKDEGYEYYFNCVMSGMIIVTYDDGSTETIREALNNGNITIADLDAHNIGYMKKPIAGETSTH